MNTYYYTSNTNIQRTVLKIKIVKDKYKLFLSIKIYRVYKIVGVFLICRAFNSAFNKKQKYSFISYQTNYDCIDIAQTIPLTVKDKGWLIWL